MFLSWLPLIPATGGQYVFLREAWGALFGFLCGWTYFFVVLSGAIAWLAISFALYLSYFIPLGSGPARIVAVALIAIVTVVNFRGVTAVTGPHRPASSVRCPIFPFAAWPA